MTKIYGVLFALMTVSSLAIAGSYRTLVCSNAEPMPGEHVYMLVVPNTDTGKGKGIILEKTSGTANDDWSLISGNAVVTQALDAGPLDVTFRDDASRIDWNLPENVNKCFYQLKDSYDFYLLESTNGTTGSLTITGGMARNPNLTHCPMLMPPRPRIAKLKCHRVREATFYVSVSDN